jgi:hypothetical protein
MFNFDKREEKLTDAEFEALPRIENGDISTKIDVQMAMIFMTDDQVSKLSEDDSTRYENLQEELRCEIAALG